VQWQRNGARLYDPVLGRLLGVETLADQYVSFSVYAYATNDPVNLLDPTGNDVVAPGGNQDIIETLNLPLGERLIRYAQITYGGGGGGNGSNTNPYGGRLEPIYLTVTNTYEIYTELFTTDYKDNTGELSVLDYQRIHLGYQTESYQKLIGYRNSSDGLLPKYPMLAMGPGGDPASNALKATYHAIISIPSTIIEPLSRIVDNEFTGDLYNHFVYGSGRPYYLSLDRFNDIINTAE